MPLTPPPEQLTPREYELMRHEAEQNQLSMDYGMKMKQLDIEVEKIQSKWSALLRLPAMIIKLPVYCILALAMVVFAITGKQPPEDLYNLLK